MSAALVGAAVATGSLAGFVTGVLWQAVGLGAMSAAVVLGLVLTVAVADAVVGKWGRPRPWSVGRQVPRAWSALFPGPTVALLYGARLGVGPLTILPTWWWWAALVVGASTGPLGGAVVLGTFGLVRGSSSVAAARWARPAMAPRMARFRSWEARAVRWSTAGGALLVALATLG